ncbi:TPA: lysostaphin resistance A-like protein [Staphylococcus aureus]
MEVYKDNKITWLHALYGLTISAVSYMGLYNIAVFDSDTIPLPVFVVKGVKLGIAIVIYMCVIMTLRSLLAPAPRKKGILSLIYPKAIVKKRYVLFIAMCAYGIQFHLRLFVDSFNSSVSDNEKRLRESLGDKSVLENIVNASVYHGIMEEVLYRGLLYMVCANFVILIAIITGLSVKHQVTNIVGVLFFLFTSSYLFGLSHVYDTKDYAHISGYIVSGVVLAGVYLLTKSIIAPIIVHFMNNFFVTMYDAYATYHVLPFNIAYIRELGIWFAILVSVVVWCIVHRQKLYELEADSVKYQSSTKRFCYMTKGLFKHALAHMKYNKSE